MEYFESFTDNEGSDMDIASEDEMYNNENSTVRLLHDKYRAYMAFCTG